MLQRFLVQTPAHTVIGQLREVSERPCDVGECAALNFEPSVTLIEERGGDFGVNLNDQRRMMPCNRN